MEFIYLRIACALGGLAVALGAFGAHGLKNRLSDDLLAIYETGVRYHFYHALALLAVSLAVPALWQSKWTPFACGAWTVGIVLFSGSLYLLAVTGARWLGATTPLGGVALILGWVFLFVAAGSLRNS